MNHRWTWDDGRINTLLEEVTRALVELEAFFASPLSESQKAPVETKFLRLNSLNEKLAWDLNPESPQIIGHLLQTDVDKLL